MKLRFEYPAPVIVKLKYRKRGAVTDWYASHHDKRKRASFGLSFPSAPSASETRAYGGRRFRKHCYRKSRNRNGLTWHDSYITSLVTLFFSGSCM